jgi:nicotinamidase/pyrazinamidase
MNRFPTFYNPGRVGTLFYPNVAAIAAEAAAAKLAPAAEDKQNVHLVIIDMQIDFCHDQGTLNVPGSIGDIQRLIEFIYGQAERITNITCSLDSHLPYQIFHPAWWADEAGNHPAPFTIITYQDLMTGKWRPLVAPTWSTGYVKRLQDSAKKALVIWPYHVPIGGIGNALDPELWSAVFWHSVARKSQPNWWSKGSIPRTEHYSIIQPEIPVPDHPQGGKSKAFLDTLAAADQIFIAGEAESHCVLETVEDLVEEFGSRPDVLEKIYILQDCTSPVRHPDVDFHALAQAQFAKFAQQGVHFINSTDPIPAPAAAIRPAVALTNGQNSIRSLDPVR